MKLRHVVFVIAGLAFAAVGIWLLAASGGQNGSEITVAAAASLADAMERLAADFQRAGGFRVRLDFASSGLLRKKIEAGARMDAFLSASAWDMDMLEDSGLLAARTRRDLLRNSLVCVIPRSSTLPIASAQDLSDQRIRLMAIGDPEHVPAGMYTKEALVRLGLWERLRHKLVPCADVRATLAQVETAAVQAAIVYRSDAKVAPKVKVAFVFPPDSHAPIVYPGCVLKASRRPAAADAFLDFLGSAQAAKIFAEYGFEVIHGQEE